MKFYKWNKNLQFLQLISVNGVTSKNNHRRNHKRKNYVDQILIDEYQSGNLVEIVTPSRAPFAFPESRTFARSIICKFSVGSFLANERISICNSVAIVTNQFPSRRRTHLVPEILSNRTMSSMLPGALRLTGYLLGNPWSLRKLLRMGQRETDRSDSVYLSRAYENAANSRRDVSNWAKSVSTARVSVNWHLWISRNTIEAWHTVCHRRLTVVNALST